MNKLSRKFTQVKGLKTTKGAEQRLERILEDAVLDKPVEYVIITQEDGTFVPLVMLSADDSYLMHILAGNGVCVWAVC